MEKYKEYLNIQAAELLQFLFLKTHVKATFKQLVK